MKSMEELNAIKEEVETLFFGMMKSFFIRV